MASAWGGFHIHIPTKNRYTITRMVLIGENKKFLHLTNGGPGSVHDARLLQRSALFQQFCRGEKIPNETMNLERR